MLWLGYDRALNHLDGRARISAIATQRLARFDLDLRGFTVSAVAVDGHSARYTRDGQEFVITPSRPLRRGRPFVVALRYAGTPTIVTDPDESIEGWVPTADGAFVAGEPQGSPGWYPVNDNPRDKATFDFVVTLPAGITAVANGELRAQWTRRGRTTFVWHEGKPMAPYLATVTNGLFQVTRSRTPGGVPTYVAVDPSQAAAAAPALAKLPAVVDFFSSLYGRYPFETLGAIVDDAPDVGYELETQTKPIFDSAPDEGTLAHELAHHQWFGDAVTLERWPDIWLHEGFATWSEWIWHERTGGLSAQQAFERAYATPAANTRFWNPPPAAPGSPQSLFAGSVYDRGAMTLQALRVKIGDRAFFRLLREWYARHRYGNVTTGEFVALAERVSGQDLAAFFRAWLYTPGKPTTW